MKKLLITKRLTALLWALMLTLMPMSLMADNTPLSVTVTFEVGSFVYEQAGNAFDGKPETKWCGGILTTNNTNAYVQVQLAEKSKLDYYYLYTGNDINYENSDGKQQRNPKEWKLYAKVNEGDEWTLISHVTDAGLPTTVSTRSNNYKIDAAYQNIEYNYLKFEILQIEKGDIFEVGEICFIKCNHTFGSDDICTECGYKKQQDDGFVNVATTIQLWNAIKDNPRAKVRLTADFALSDINKDGETYCNTFYGTIDGNGHTIKGDPKADVRARTYMFTYSEGATFKNLTFKGIRVNSQEHSNQAIITSQAKNGCVFENITFDNVHSFSNYNNVGAAAGYAYDCTFTNIKVKNSDFTVDDNYVGSVVGDADKCTFTNIEVTNCKTYAHDDCAGGIVGHSRNCKFTNVDVKNSFFQVDGYNVGGVAGKSIEGSQFTNCVVDDQSCICSDGTYLVGALAGGITGFSDNCKFYDCINSALIASNDELVGGIIGQAINNTFVDGCLNTGMLVYMKTEEVNNSYYNKYKTMSGMTGVTKTYNGKEYLIRKVDDRKGDVSAYGGIVGYMINCTISRCANLGTLTTEHSCGGIVGISQSEYIRDCLVDFHGTNNGVIGIAGYVWHDKTTIANSLNISPFGYYCCNDGTCYADNVVDHPKEDEQKLGVACAKLGVNWQQNIGTDPYPTPTGNKGVYHTRKVTNQYGTVCLPFALKSDDKISYYTLSRKEDDEQGIKLVFTYLDEVMPGYPVLFRAAEAKDADADNPVEICFNNAGKEITTTPTNKTLDAGFWDVWGTFEQRVFEGDLAKNIYYVSGGEIRNAKKVTIAPYRAWIYGPNIETLNGSNGLQAKTVQFVIDDENGETTALEFVGNDLVPVKNTKTYSIVGTEVGDGYRGIVIKNGKKVVIK